MRKTEKYTDARVWVNAKAFLLGFVLIGSQIILLREFLHVFNGNELVVGLLLSMWMLISGAGAWSGKHLPGKKASANFMSLLFLLLILFPLVSIISLGYLQNIFIETGRMISLYEAMTFSFVLLLPVCFIGGFLFTLLNRTEEKMNASPQELYGFESLGSLAGGVLVGILFIYLQGADNFQALQYLVLISFVFLGILYFRKKELLRSLFFLSLAVLMLLMLQFFDLAYWSRQKLYPGQLLVQTTDTPYGSIDITQTGNQKNIYENGILISATDNVIGKEEDVHYALLQRPEARKVLLLGGGVSGTPLEILKYKSVGHVDYLEINPVLFKIVINQPDTNRPGIIHAISSDPVFFIKNTTSRYDVVLINEPPPSNVQTNRFYTLEFYRKLKRILRKGGVISTRLPASENYLSDAELELESVIFNTLKTVFKDVIVIPGKQHYFLASDSSLSMSYTKRIVDTELNNQFVNTAYLNDRLLQMRSAALQNEYLKDVPLNHDFKPSVYMIFIKQWLHFFGNHFQPILLLAVAMVLLFLLFAKPNATVMFSSGFTGASTEIVLLFAFQSILGYLYLFPGLMIAVFMGGLATGVFFSRFNKNGHKPASIFSIQLASALYILSLTVLLYFTQMLSNAIAIQIAFGLMMFLVAVLVGLQYGTIFHFNKLKSHQLVSVVYPADLIGAGLGSFLTALWLVPAYGIYYSLLILGALHFVSMGLVFMKQKKK